jgi:hypothetical protein
MKKGVYYKQRKKRRIKVASFETSHGLCGLNISLESGSELNSTTAYSAPINVELRVHAVPIAKALRTQMSVLCLFQPRRKVMSQEQLKILS